MSTDPDFSTIFSRLEKLSLTSSLPATLPDISHYDFLAAASNSQFIYFTRLSRLTSLTPPTSDTSTSTITPSTHSTSTTDQEFYVPFFTDSYHTLLHEIANYYDLKNGVADIKCLHIKAEGTEMDGGFAELDLGLDRIDSVGGWRAAQRRLADMGFGSEPAEGAGRMGEGVVVVVELV